MKESTRGRVTLAQPLNLLTLSSNNSSSPPCSPAAGSLHHPAHYTHSHQEVRHPVPLGSRLHSYILKGWSIGRGRERKKKPILLLQKQGCLQCLLKMESVIPTQYTFCQIQRIVHHGPLAIHSVCALRKTQGFINSPCSLNGKQTKLLLGSNINNLSPESWTLQPYLTDLCCAPLAFFLFNWSG